MSSSTDNEPTIESKMPDSLQSFTAFSTTHSWYKHLIGDNTFALIPYVGKCYRNFPDASWWYIADVATISQYGLDPEMRRVIESNTVLITPFVYSHNHGFMHTIGEWGWPMFDWLCQNGYVSEANQMLPHVVDNQAAGDSRYKLMYRGEDDHNTSDCKGPVANIFAKEQARMLDEVQVAARNIWAQLIEKGWSWGEPGEPKSLNITSQNYIERKERYKKDNNPSIF